MQIGKYTISRKNIINFIAKSFFGMNSKKYWDNRFKRDWVSSAGRVQTGIFAASFCFQDFGISPKTIIDYGCGAGDSVPFLKMRYPSSKIYLYDFSDQARKLAETYQNYATICNHPLPLSEFELVYCSNVVEHIADIQGFLDIIQSMSSKFIAIQAPYSEFHIDGSIITPESPKGEHLRTIDDSFLGFLPDSFMWEKRLIDAPYGWDYGKQVVFFGIKK